MTRQRRSLAAALMALAGACSAASHNAPATHESSPDYVTATEIEATPASNAYDLIRRLRPGWLRPQGTGSLAGGIRSQVILVYLDGSRIGNADMLQSVTATGLKSMRYYDAARAATVLNDVGSEPVAGAIVITTRNAPKS